MRALRRFVPAFRNERPSAGRLRNWALAGDLVANSIYYAAVPARTKAETWTRAATLGLSAGVGALLLPPAVGLGDPPNSHSSANKAMTLAWYVAGAIVAASAANMLTGAPRRQV